MEIREDPPFQKGRDEKSSAFLFGHTRNAEKFKGLRGQAHQKLT